MEMDKITRIKKVSSEAMDEARAHIDRLAKPLGSLGRLEEYAIKLAGIRGYMGCAIRKSGVLVFAADNGIHEEGFSSVPQSVTAAQAVNIANGTSGVGVFAAQSGSEVWVYNVGMKETPASDAIKDICVRRGTANMTKGPAMTREECEKAFEEGFNAARKHTDCDILGIGEMGICNTSTSSAVLSVIAGLPVKEVTGRGCGLTDEQYDRKVEAIRKAISVNNPDKSDVFDVISKVGGLDIAAMTGAYFGAAFTSTPVVIDGFISAVAALCAYRLNERIADYMFASHRSAEKGYDAAIKRLHLKPALDLEMRLGEGSGCPLMFSLLNSSLLMVDNMAKITTAGLSHKDLVDNR